MNSVVVNYPINTVVISLFDVYTTTYFLGEAMTLEEHKEAGSA